MDASIPSGKLVRLSGSLELLGSLGDVQLGFEVDSEGLSEGSIAWATSSRSESWRISEVFSFFEYGGRTVICKTSRLGTTIDLKSVGDCKCGYKFN